MFDYRRTQETLVFPIIHRNLSSSNSGKQILLMIYSCFVIFDAGKLPPLVAQDCVTLREKLDDGNDQPVARGALKSTLFLEDLGDMVRCSWLPQVATVPSYSSVSCKTRGAQLTPGNKLWMVPQEG